MNHEEFIKQIHRRIAIVSVGGSALRNQGAAGIVDISRKYFEDAIDLKVLFSNLTDEGTFQWFLDLHTDQLVNLFPKHGKSWGAARKGLNLFFRDLVYNKIIATEFGLSWNLDKYNAEIQYLEVPLDGFVGRALYKTSDGLLPKWKTIKELKPSISEQYQAVALQVAKELEVARVHLDLLLWRKPSD